MSVLIKETQGDTITGVIDSSNTDYEVSFDFISDSVNVYVNGILKVRDWDDGFYVIPPRTIRMKIPLILGPGPDDIDSLEIEYQANIKIGGGAEGGCPLAPVTVEEIPIVDADEEIPSLTADELKPDTDADGIDPPLTLTTSIRPTILPNDDGGCTCP